MKARTRSRTLRWCSSSTALMTSTAKGRTAATARPTLDGSRPPARMQGATPASTTVRARFQSTALPVPAGRPGMTESTSTASAPASMKRRAAAASTSAFGPGTEASMRNALMRRMPLPSSLAASWATQASVSSRWSCRAWGSVVSTASRIERALPPTIATRVTNGGTIRISSAARFRDRIQGLASGYSTTKPRASAPSSTAMARSSGWVIPQILTLTVTGVSGGSAGPAHGDQRPDRLGRVGGLEDGGADQDGIGAGLPRPPGVVGAPDGALGQQQRAGGQRRCQPFGDADVAVVDLADEDVAVVDAEQVGPQAEVGDAGDVLVVVDFDEGLEAPLPGGGVEAGQSFVVEHADRDQDDVGARGDGLVEAGLGADEVLPEDGDI